MLRVDAIKTKNVRDMIYFWEETLPDLHVGDFRIFEYKISLSVRACKGLRKKGDYLEGNQYARN